jgi:hypothetical protein
MRHPGTNLITCLLTAVVVTGCIPTTVATRQSPVEQRAPRHGSSCAMVDAPTTGPVVGTGDSITVTVPRTVLLRMDKRGHIIAAATNTGCPPQAGDDVYVISPDGSIARSAAVDIASTRWVGNFATPGAFEPQRSGG